MIYENRDFILGPIILMDEIDFLVNMSASADVLAMAKVEVDLNTIPEGKNVRDQSYGREGLLDRLILLSLMLILLKCFPGHHQMARQTCLHPSSYSGRDPRSSE